MKKAVSTLLERYLELKTCKNDIMEAYECLRQSYKNGGKVLVCGNGGSASDSEHIVAELMKGFKKHRSLSDGEKNSYREAFGEEGRYISERLQGALPAISLSSHTALGTAFSNDVAADLVFAQQVNGLGRSGDVLIGLSTSGNADNVIRAMQVAKLKGLKVIGMTGADGGRFKSVCDVTICVPQSDTPYIQELHLPIYHTLCLMLEEYFF